MINEITRQYVCDLVDRMNKQDLKEFAENEIFDRIEKRLSFDPYGRRLRELENEMRTFYKYNSSN